MPQGFIPVEGQVPYGYDKVDGGLMENSKEQDTIKEISAMRLNSLK
jgi:hypothetical protein